MKQYYYTFTPEVEGTISGILEASKKMAAHKHLKEEIERGYQGSQKIKAIKTLRVSEV